MCVCVCACESVALFPGLLSTGSVFAYCKRSKTGAGEGLGTRLVRVYICECVHVCDVAHSVYTNCMYCQLSYLPIPLELNGY